MHAQRRLCVPYLRSRKKNEVQRRKYLRPQIGITQECHMRRPSKNSTQGSGIEVWHISGYFHTSRVGSTRQQARRTGSLGESFLRLQRPPASTAQTKAHPIRRITSSHVHAEITCLGVHRFHGFGLSSPITKCVKTLRASFSCAASGVLLPPPPPPAPLRPAPGRG